jgi:hypothetical protein
MNDLAPIVLFVYNRPWHTQQALESLMRNKLAEKSVLYIYADGCKENLPDHAVANFLEVRKVIRQKKWCGRVEMIESDTNKGLAASIIGGVTEIVNQYGKIIVLEDDIITSPFFLEYANSALNKYATEDKVKCISGYMYPVKKKLQNTFFLKFDSCWGWATWKRAWDEFESDATCLKERILKKGLVEQFNFNNRFDFFSMLENYIEGKNDSWSIRWYASIFIREGLTLFPRTSYIQNIGNDGSGIHSGVTKKFDADRLNSSSTVSFSDNLTEDKLARESMEIFFKKLNEQTLLEKVKHKLKNLFLN